jgi:hypothetical protein
LGINSHSACNVMIMVSEVCAKWLSGCEAVLRLKDCCWGWVGRSSWCIVPLRWVRSVCSFCLGVGITQEDGIMGPSGVLMAV